MLTKTRFYQMIALSALIYGCFFTNIARAATCPADSGSYDRDQWYAINTGKLVQPFAIAVWGMYMGGIACQYGRQGSFDNTTLVSKFAVNKPNPKIDPNWSYDWNTGFIKCTSGLTTCQFTP